MAPLPGYPVAGRFSSALLLPLLLFHPLSKAQGDRCPPINIENGRIVKSSDMRLGDEITLACNEGYRLMGEKTLRCVLVDGKLDWHARPPFCHRIRCYPPDNIPFGSHSGQPFEEFQYGSVVIYTCREGFSLIGNPVRTCSTSADGNHGEWQPAPPQCKVIRCREPEIKNGRVTSKPQPFYTYGDRANFECNPGYIMVGNSTCTCGPDYGWIPRFPICVESTPNATAATPPTAATPATPADPGGDDTIVPEIGTGADPALPPDDIEVDNSTTIIVGCVLGLLVIGSIAAVFWKFRSSAKTGEPEAPPPESAAEFDAAELEPKGSVVE